MDFDLNTEQKMLQKSAREFFSKELDSEMVREMEKDATGHSPQIWKKMARIGWMGLLIPEAFGGEEMGVTDMAIVLKEMGYAAFTSPYFFTAVVGVSLLLTGGSERQKKKLLPVVAKGKKILTLAWNETGVETACSGLSATAEIRGDHYLLNGTKTFVPFGHVADQIVVAVRTGPAGESGEDGISLFIVDRDQPGVNVEVVETMADDKSCELNFENLKIPTENMLGEKNQGWPILKSVFQVSAALKCAEMVGGARKVLQMTVNYAKKREQFSRPIGSFQAIQHHCADMITHLETSDLILLETCWRLDRGGDCAKQVSMCKAWVNENCRRLYLLGHQVMGGFGFMEEVDHQLYYRRGKAAEAMFGNADYHREAVARHMEG
ncbi:acyl-CoA dehydrogenase family protein [uncultured Desulfosarcina sp.]|uniref:acyl-CoA dehydrogenase family protein n=1 Tax=uncultured Desulfosarcina sp. TaxID=218289 RepID=UPI0029C7CC50|nr:acyl-CoA dehydrogenase family protein [uncultured Desulfosarcina sp.]